MLGSDEMSKLADNWGYMDSLSSKKNRNIDMESFPKEIQHKLKLIEKAFR
jgi:hypothetical protein